MALGYTKLSWDDESGQERQPLASFKSWSQLTANEKAGALLLGYDYASWDNVLGSEIQPMSASKNWDELLLCGEGKPPSASRPPALHYCYSPCPCLFVVVAHQSHDRAVVSG